MAFLQLMLLAAAVQLTVAYNILVVVPMPAKSHIMLFEPLVIELAKRGHQVTYMTPHPPKKSVPNVHLLEIPVDKSHVPPDLFGMRHFGALENALFLPFLGVQVCNATMVSPQFRELLNTKTKFDAIIVEAFLTESLAAGLSYKLKAPLIGYGTFMPSYWVNFWIGNIAPSSFIPDPFTNLPMKMNFLQRTWNFLFQIIAPSWHFGFHLNTHDQLMRQYFGSDLPPIGDLIRNTSLLLVNDHFSTSFPRPANPNLISIAGLHVKPPKPLPQDIQNYLDSSKNGAIIFTLGSNLKSSDMGDEKIQIFLDAFAKMKENVLWKFEKELSKKPKNVMVLDWLPQSDILAHPNIKLFITHGGLLGTTESIDRGVPIVGIPIFGDQPMNTQQSVNAGVGLKLDFDSLTVEGVYNTIREVIDNPKYREAAQSRSRQFKDRPQSPMDLAIYWIEYVVRHKGAAHLRSTVQDLYWFQAAQVDVVVIIISVLLISLWVAKCLVKVLWRTLCSKKPTVKQSKKKN